MIRIVTKAVGWIADMVGSSLTIRTSRAREIAARLDPEKQYVIEIREYRKNRSLDQNAMYWSILTQYAKAAGVSNNRAHNEMLRAYGFPMIVGGYYAVAKIADTDEAENEIIESDQYHLKPTSRRETGPNGQVFRYYCILRGSSTYDTAEFKRLIDGLVDEAKQVGVELLADDL